MKKTLKEIEFSSVHEDVRFHGNKDIIHYRTYTHTFDCKEDIIDLSKIKMFQEIEEEDTIEEFINKHDLNPRELLEWLNNHYNKKKS